MRLSTMDVQESVVKDEGQYKGDTTQDSRDIDHLLQRIPCGLTPSKDSPMQRAQ